MSGFDRRGAHPGIGSNSAHSGAATPAKSTLVDATMPRTTHDFPATPVQRATSEGGRASTGQFDGGAVQQAAATGVTGTGGALPHGQTIQRLFGRHDVGGIKAHVGGAAETASRAIGAEAYATEQHVAFVAAPTLHTAAHEAAHVVQQRGGIQLKGGVGAAGDAHEQHADQVADAVVLGKSAEGLLDRYAGGSGSASGVQRQAAQSDQKAMVPDAKADAGKPSPRKESASVPESTAAATRPTATTPATATPVTATPAAATPGVKPATDTTITDTTRVESVEMLHVEEIFADVPANTVAKKHAFDRLNKAVRAAKTAENAVAAAKTPKANTKANAALIAAQAEVTSATSAISEFIAESRFKTDTQLDDLKTQLATATKKSKQKTIDAATKQQLTDEIAEIKQAVEDRKTAIRAEVAEMKHTEVDHTTDSVFAPVATDVTHHDFAFADDEHVKLRDHVVAYATTVSFGVDSEGAIDHAQVRDVMATAGLSESRRKILQAISGFEGGFDTVNTYDRAKVTWGFVQWTGGRHSDLTQTLTIIKQQHPEAFAQSFQAYGIDVVSDQLVITPPDGSAAIEGDAAAAAIMRNPRLAAALAHAGRSDDIQTGQVQAASQIEIEHALSQQVQFGEGKNMVTTTAGALITSEYGVGVLANTFVHSGSGAAYKTTHTAVVGYLAEHPYVAGSEEWRAGAEAAIVSALGAKDSDRAAALRTLLSEEPGSFQ
jgi:hypothetical protein